jgi:hypothetical protein
VARGGIEALNKAKSLVNSSMDNRMNPDLEASRLPR